MADVLPLIIWEKGELTDAKICNVPRYICGDDLGQSTPDTGNGKVW